LVQPLQRRMREQWNLFHKSRKKWVHETNIVFTGGTPQKNSMDRQGRIHKRGPRLLRSALTEAAWLMLRYNPWARSVYERLVGGQKTRKKKAIVALARKLLVRCWVMLMRNEPWSLPRHRRIGLRRRWGARAMRRRRGPARSAPLSKAQGARA
jgi:hypothetical protein